MNARQQIWGVKPAETGPLPKARRRAGKTVRVPLPPRGAQLSFADKKSWGGPRPGSGRKVAAVRPKVRHRVRPEHRAYQPVHVTMRRAKGLPSFRVERLERVIREAIRATRRAGFRIVEYSVQADHLHLLIEADDARALTNGMKSFAVRVAMRVNHRVLRRPRGRVWGDRYHRRELVTPSEVRNALVYVLNNHIKHGEWEVGLIDPCSSAPWFGGWMHMRDAPPIEPCAAERPTTWLLGKGWSTVGLGPLNVGEVPRSIHR